MKSYLFLIVAFALLMFGCNARNQENSHGDEYGETSLLLSNYNDDFELFAEVEPLVVGQSATLAAHLTHLSDFKPLAEGAVTVRLVVGDKEIQQTLNQPTTSGIYVFKFTPETVGVGELHFTVADSSQFTISDVEVFADEQAAISAAEEKMNFPSTAATFTKEQSWKIDFSTGQPQLEPFGQVIKTTAQVLSAPIDESIVTANSNGVVLFSSNHLLEGTKVSKGELLYSISSSGLAGNNSSLQFIEAQNNYYKAKSDYERASALSKDKIVSEKELLEAENRFNNAKAIYDNYVDNYTATGQKVVSPMDGFVGQVFVQNGEYVEAGQPIVVVAQNRTLLLKAEVQQKYAPMLSGLNSATLRFLNSSHTYTLEELNGRILSYGRSASRDNFLIPVSLQVENDGAFVLGGFVELYLKTETNKKALTVPNSALLEEQGNYFVYVQIHPELFEKREVRVGATDGLRTEIIKGVEPESRVVTHGAIMIKLAEATGDLDAHAGHMH